MIDGHQRATIEATLIEAIAESLFTFRQTHGQGEQEVPFFFLFTNAPEPDVISNGTLNTTFECPPTVSEPISLQCLGHCTTIIFYQFLHLLLWFCRFEIVGSRK